MAFLGGKTDVKGLHILRNGVSILTYTGLLNRLTNKKEQSRGACSKCGYCMHLNYYQICAYKLYFLHLWEYRSTSSGGAK